MENDPTLSSVLGKRDQRGGELEKECMDVVRYGGLKGYVRCCRRGVVLLLEGCLRVCVHWRW